MNTTLSAGWASTSGVVRIDDLDSAIVEIKDIPRCKIRAVNPGNAGDDGVRDRDRCNDKITVAISRLDVERQLSLSGLAECYGWAGAVWCSPDNDPAGHTLTSD